MKVMKDVDIVKELPPDLKSLDIEAIGSLVCHYPVSYLNICDLC